MGTVLAVAVIHHMLIRKEINIELVLTKETEESKSTNSNTQNNKQNQNPNFSLEDFFNNWFCSNFRSTS